MNTVLDKFNPDIHFFIHPYPHLIIENALPNSTYEDLVKQYPISLIKHIDQNNQRGDIHPEEIFNINNQNIWKEFLNTHQSEYFLKKLLNVFKMSLLDKYKYMSKFFEKNELIINRINNNRKEFFKNIKKKNIGSNELFYCSDIGYNTPVDKISSVRGAHLDGSTKYLIGLYYLRDLDSREDFGGKLEISKWRDGLTNIQKRKLIEKNDYKKTNIIKSVEYKGNTLVFFMNSIDSLHGVSNRKLTKEIRKFVYFSLEYPKKRAFKKHNNFLEKLLINSFNL